MLYHKHVRDMIGGTTKVKMVEGIPPLNLPKSKGKALKDYKIYGNSYQRLPQEYQEVEYIENAGSAYIRTGFLPKDIDEVEVKASVSDLSKNKQYFVGTRNSASTAIGYSLYFTEHGGVWYYPLTWSGSGFTPEQNEIFTTKSTFQNGTDKFYYNGVLKNTHTHIGTAYTSGNQIYIGAIRTGSGSADYISYARYYDIVFRKDGVDIAHFIPCKNLSNVAGLYDVVNNQFYSSYSSTQFTTGEEVVPTPDKPIEIESVGERTNNLFNGTFPVISSYRVSDPIVELGTQIAVSITDKDTSVDLTGIYLAVVDSTSYSSVLGNYLVHNGIINQRDFTTNVRNRLAIYPSTDKAVNTILNRFNIQVSAGSTITPYEPYGKYKIPVKATNGIDIFTTNIYLNEPLRKIGTYADYIDFKNKKVVRKFYKRLLDKNSVWYSQPIITIPYAFGPYVTMTGWGADTTIPKYPNYMLCNICKNDQGGQAAINLNTISPNAMYTNMVFCLDSRIVGNDLTEFKTWLDDKIIELIYPLATPTEESIELPQILTAKGTTILSIGTKVKPSNMLVKYILR